MPRGWPDVTPERDARELCPVSWGRPPVPPLPRGAQQAAPAASPSASDALSAQAACVPCGLWGLCPDLLPLSLALSLRPALGVGGGHPPFFLNRGTLPCLHVVTCGENLQRSWLEGLLQGSSFRVLDRASGTIQKEKPRVAGRGPRRGARGLMSRPLEGFSKAPGPPPFELALLLHLKSYTYV